MKYAIETFSLTKVFSDWWGRDKVRAVNDLNLRVRHNEVFGLLGPNGSGKTTTLKMLLGLLYPTKGRSVVLDGDSREPKISARIGFLPEESYLYRYLNARETLDFYGRLFGLPAKLRKLRTESLLDMIGLKAVANRPVGTFSKGMARRIGLAQALINDPDLLILDEPTTGLDPIGTRQIKDLILELAKRGKTILLCSHLLADVEDVCDRIAILYGGRIQAEGRVTELLEQTGKRQITTGKISDGAVERIKQLVADEESDCEVTSPMDKLENFFINTVADAQQQAQPTSGAVSTTGIGGFLAADKPVDSILDDLVSASVAQDTGSAAPLGTEQVNVVETSGPEPDQQLLHQLTESNRQSPAQGEDEQTTAQTKPVQPKPVPEPQIKKSILDELTSGPTMTNKQDDQSDESPGGGSDA
ncbi:MAG: ABC transporter ATP-binding protein [Planctomycetota bacterium]|jgi:ABC-2 type transport system ATP-binding protein